MGIVSNSFKGFETVYAGIRMFYQMILRLLFVAIILQAIIITTIVLKTNYLSKLTDKDVCLIQTYYRSKLQNSISFKKDNLKVNYGCQGNAVMINYNKFIITFEPFVIERVQYIKKKLLQLFLLTSIIYLFIPLLLIFFSKKHKTDTEDKYLRGAQKVVPENLKKLIDERAGDIDKFKITNNIEIPSNVFNRHLILMGRPGSGKTQFLLRVIDKIIKSGHKAIIHDYKGDFISSFFDHKKHLIYNPLDKRHMGLKNIEIDLIKYCSEIQLKNIEDDYLKEQLIKENITSKMCKELNNKSYKEKTLSEISIINAFKYSYLLDHIKDIIDSIKSDKMRNDIVEYQNKLKYKHKGWSLFSELKSSIDIDAFCASLIPESASHDNFFPISARQILGSIITYCLKNGIKSYSELWQMVNLDNISLINLFSETEGCEEGLKLLTEAKTANNILAVLSNYTKPIKYLIGTEGNFSIKDWVEDNSSDVQIIFLSNYAMIQETIRPFLTMFADFSIKTLLSLEDDLDRRFFIILDEFGELDKIGTVVPMCTGSRSKGGAGIISIQDSARVHSIYGKEGTSTIFNACGNLVSFGVKKDEAEFASLCFGSSEIKRTEESNSMGVDNISDSLSISRQTVEKRLVMPSEVTNLPDLNFYIQMPNYPVSRDKLDIVKFPSKSQPYIGREDFLLKEVKTSDNNLPLVRPEDAFFAEISGKDEIKHDSYIPSDIDYNDSFIQDNYSKKIVNIDENDTGKVVKSLVGSSDNSGRIFG